MPKRVDFIKPFVLAAAGIVGSAVAILVAAAAGAANKEGDMFRPLFAVTMIPLAVTVVVATIAVVLLQALRTLWFWAPDMPLARKLHDRPWLPTRLGALVLCTGLTMLPAWPSYYAAKSIVTATVNVITNQNFDQPVTSAQRDRLPWIFRRFYRFRSWAPARPEATAPIEAKPAPPR